MIAGGEDTILFLGPGSIPVRCRWSLRNESAGRHTTGISGRGGDRHPILPAVNVQEQLLSDAAPPTSVGDIIGAVAEGMANLNARSQPGPYALFLSPERYAQTFAPSSRGPARNSRGPDQSRGNRRLLYGQLFGGRRPAPAPPPPDLEFWYRLAASLPKSFSGPMQR